ncbi:MAG: hypothetical protein A2Y40_04245 [Candidatus Margulisbacteria bacterium GWF2_35_9]|nr:MAG: hypothetical protein A2Y40_04245 [Candidatus Margulisbacteria bacterium GWF2_35_9]
MSVTKKILIIRPDEMGDVILTFPMLLELKIKFPRSEIYYLCAEYTKPLIEMHPLVSGVIIDKLNKGKSVKNMTSQLIEMKAYQFDIVIHCYNEFLYAYLALRAKIPIRIGDASKLAPRLLHNYKVSQGFRNIMNHEVDLNLKLLEPLGISKPDQGIFGFENYRSNESTLIKYHLQNKRYVIIHPGLGKGNRKWPINNYKKIVTFLQDEGFMVVVTGGKAEVERNNSISSGMCDVINLTGRTDILEVADIIRNATFFVSVDTGPMHLAAALKIPVVLLSPSKYVKPNRWGPYGVSNTVVSPKGACKKRCFPYSCQDTDCMDALTVDDVKMGIRRINLKSNFVAIDQIKKKWLKVSLNILDLASNLLIDEEYHVYQKKDISGSLLKFIVENDINLIIKDKITWIDRIMNSLVAIYLSHPPVFITTDQYKKSGIVF